MMKRSLGLCSVPFAVGLLCASFACGGDLLQAGKPVLGTPLELRMVEDSMGRSIEYYISKPKKEKAPILLMIQGSGCARVINVQDGGAFSTLYNFVPYAAEGDFAVMAVEKPFSGGNSSGTATKCSPKFNQDFTAESWLVAIRAALQDARKLPWIDSARTLVFGFSEGAVMADVLAGRDETVTDVISMSGSGTTQLFDFFALAYSHCFDASKCVADIDRNVAAILANPNSSTEFAWGHPYKRWTSFFRIDPGDELLHSKARIYMAFGTADESVPALSAEMAVARLTLAGKDLTVRRVPNAGHSLSESRQSPFQDLDREYRAALDWFWHRTKVAQTAAH